MTRPLTSPTALPPPSLQPPLPAPPAAIGGDLSRIKEAARAFEAQVIAEFLKPLFEGLSTAPPFGGGQGEAVMRSLLLEQYGRQMQARGGLGLAAAIEAQLLAQAGRTTKAAPAPESATESPR